ncbi:MAG: hypothetical protein NVSMB44_24260 [Ktedonobacteraceae bacterium]
MGRGRYNSRDQWYQRDEDEGRLPQRQPGDIERDDRYIYEDEYGDEVRPPRRRASDAPYPPRRARGSRGLRPTPSTREYAPRRSARLQRKRSVWPALLGGCALGIFLVVLAAALVVVFAIRNLQGGGTIASLPGMISMKSFTKNEAQGLQLSQVSQILVCDQVGNVTLHVDPTITKPMLTTRKTVRASNQAGADDELKKLVVEVQPPGTITHTLACARSQGTPTTQGTPTATGTPPTSPNPPNSSTGAAGATGNAATTLIVNVLFPNADSLNHAVDLNIALPPGALLSENGPSLPVDVEAPRGDINVDGVSGVLNIRGGTGNVTVKHAVLADGSHIETAQGNVTFNGFLATTPGSTGQNARYIFQSEHNVDVTLPANINVTLDANTNVGTISSDFPISPTNDNGAMSYHGPLNTASSAATKPTATLVVDVSTGNVTIHRSPV